MGGDGSGRHPNPATLVAQMQNPIAISQGAEIFMPNYSGLQAVKLTDPAIGTGTGTETDPVFLALSGSIATQWTTSGSSIFYDGGNVAVGAVNPVYPLYVYKNVTGFEAVIRNNDVGGTGLLVVGGDATSGSNILELRETTHPKFVFKANGKCGINTDAPNFNLDVVGTINGTLLSGSDIHTNTFSGGSVWANSFSGSSYIGTIQTLGTNVGIGTVVPSTKLEVNGTISGSALFVTSGVAAGVNSLNTNGAMQINNTTSYNACLDIISDQGDYPTALLVRNNTNYAMLNHLVDLRLLNGSDSGNIINITNAGTGNAIKSNKGNIDLGNGIYKICGANGFTGTVTTGSLVGKTITISGGIIIGFA